MNIKLLSAAVGIALSAAAFSANAQKAYTEGCVTISTSMRGMNVQAKQYFTADSSATLVTMGPANVKMLTDAGHKSFAVVLDVPVASMKKAGIATPDELDQAMSSLPTFTFTPTAETKQISGFNCKKVTAKDNKSGQSYDVWVTNDVTLPSTAIPFYYKDAGGVPIQYTAFQQGQGTSVTVTSITDEKAPKGTFFIPADYDKMTLEELQQQGGGGNH
ncbi:MAG TPA: hypothetical protein VG367_04110 [Mucilaginibacter sp.]|jgi:hypothetical protein|nr:hypothetical protein [Mucilaginibacter sp.]